jgi:hypothetical protein
LSEGFRWKSRRKSFSRGSLGIISPSLRARAGRGQGLVMGGVPMTKRNGGEQEDEARLHPVWPVGRNLDRRSSSRASRFRLRTRPFQAIENRIRCVWHVRSGFPRSSRAIEGGHRRHALRGEVRRVVERHKRVRGVSDDKEFGFSWYSSREVRPAVARSMPMP